MKLSFYGAAGEVTGSNYLLETAKASVVVDCGAFQGGKDQELKNAAPFLYKPEVVDAVVVTHAHLDHVGRLPKLVTAGFRGHLWCTPATKDLMELILRDSANIMSHDELKFGDEPLFSDADVSATLARCQTLEYDTRIEIADGVDIRLVDAGHILGSASVELWAEGRKLLFSGDLGNAGAPIVRDPTPVTEADVVISESTYGGRTHETADERMALLDRTIRATASQRGVLLIPAFALERTQELLYHIHHLIEERTIPVLPMYLDSPLAIKTTTVFGHYERLYDAEATAHLEHGESLLHVPNLHLTRTVEQSKAINHAPKPKIILAGAGMMTGGRIKYHLREYLADPSTILLIVGYQAEGTLGRRIIDGVRTVDLFGERVPVRAQIVKCGAFSAHADHPQLLRWIGAVKQPEHVFLTHGDPKAARFLHDDIEASLHYRTHVPRFGEKVPV